ncbi:MAG: TonB-dependent receptor [Cyclobacteriaceae bacterium]|nr:TonB-dependent receptor [Cyclobacteriaceae bacterium]
MKTQNIMKTLNNYLVVFCLVISITTQGQELTQSIKGKIIDIDTQTPLPGAYVIVLDSDPMKGAVSDIDGNYKITDVKIGRQNLKVSFIGYEDLFFNQVVLTTGSELILNVSMKEAVNQLEEIVIKPKDILGEPINSMASVSAQRLTVETTSRVAAGINDPGRTIQSYAGVSAADDENNEIVVRGNSPRGMLWRMEGVEIPNPNHFSNGEGGSGGGVSALSTEVLDDSDFFTGAFSAEYGNALSSVFDLRLRNGNFEKREYSFQAGVLGFQAALEGPFSKNSEASYLINYRYSTTSVLNNFGFEIGASDIFPAWQDVSLNINLPTKNMGRFNIWGLGGLSSSSGLAETDTSKWMYRGDAYSYSEKHRLGIIGVSHNYLFSNNKSYLKTVASFSHSNNIELEDSINYNLIEASVKNEAFGYNTFTATSFLNHKFNAQHVIRTGVIYTNQRYNLLGKYLNYDIGVLETQANQTGTTERYQAYFQWKYRVSPTVDINTGVHYTYLAINKDYAVEPRIGLFWQVKENQSISLGGGLHSKAEPSSIYLAQQEQADLSILYPNKNLKMTKALHGVIGYNLNFAETFHFKAEMYYQHLYDVPVQPNDTTGTVSALNFSSGFTNQEFINKGTGRNYGLELTVEKSFSKNYYFMTTASIFESKYTMPDGIERNTLFNSKYIYNLVGGKEFEVGKNKQNILGINLRMMWRGGYRTIPVDFVASKIADEDIRVYDSAFETKAPDYFRVDAGISFRKNKPNWSWELSANIQNATNRLNVWDEYYDVETNTLQQIYMVGLLPILNYKVEF